MIKSISLLTRKPEMTAAAFRKVWLEEHAPMVRSVPGVRRYTLSFPLSEPTRPDVPTLGVAGAIDAIAELWYDDRATQQKVAASPEMKQVTDNGALYLGAIKTYISEEIEIIA
ncbi:MAG: EthD domain-containing protein [Hyphomicrobiaceae bacterium]|nr:EthD domain-containing protein [Hyphomicrobiaceae bacterium]